MSEEKYQVLFKGVMPGFEGFLGEIKPEFSKRFGLSLDVVERLFNSETRVIKKDVELQRAKRLCEVLREMGIDWEIADENGEVIDVELAQAE